MTATTLVAPISLSNDLLTGAECSPAHTREFHELSEKFHPCQALGEFFTLVEKLVALRGFKLAYVGDGNNVCYSLIYLAARLGALLRVATPEEYAPLPEVVADSKRVARETKAKIELLTDPRAAVNGPMGVYTDSWTSMGFEAEGQVRNTVSHPYQSNPHLMPLPLPQTFFLPSL